jgi:hypothetical protein
MSVFYKRLTLEVSIKLPFVKIEEKFVRQAMMHGVTHQLPHRVLFVAKGVLQLGHQKELLQEMAILFQATIALATPTASTKIQIKFIEILV